MEDPLMSRLQEKLQQRNLEPHRAAEIDAEVWEELGAERAVLVLDMSGFTRTTKEYGIVHFLAMHSKAMQLSESEIVDEGGVTIKRDADNLIALFDHSEAAVQAAIRIHRNVSAYNKGVEYARQIGVCIGISFGRILKTDLDVFGDAVNVAYKLGEDIADPWEILISDAAYAEIPRKQAEAYEFGRREEAITGKVRLGFHRVVFSL